MDIIDFNFENDTDIQPGAILVSEPFMNDDYFSRSVVFLCDHSEDGSYGFVLNKYITNKISEVIEGFPEVETKISLGGPVDTSNLFYIHSLGKEIPNSLPAANGMYIGGEFETVKALLTEFPEKAKQIRFFIGYSGWSDNQLQGEIDEKSWIALNKVPKKMILDTSKKEIWKKMLEQLGGKFKVMSKFPKNPSDN
ncbi:MAG: YqgE/AlgH family protein [Crocinitomicaceae bacterium]